MDNKKQVRAEIAKHLQGMRENNLLLTNGLSDRCHLSEYRHLSEACTYGRIWTKALQAALLAHEIVVIDPSDAVYYIDGTVVIPSDRHIEATGATVRLTPDCDVLMLRNEHTKDGTLAPFDTSDRDRNISIHGGRWEESRSARAGYGVSGRYAPRKEGESRRPFYGVSTCMLFNNVEGLTLLDMTFANTAGFAVQMGDLRNGVFENIGFESCYADGLHINGRTENVYIHHVFGDVGDDLVALNAYDWQDSSVDFGPIRGVWCEDLTLFASSRYKALRIEPGIYAYADGSTVDCGIFDAVFKDIKGIRTFKLYLQTPQYALGQKPEWGDAGSGDNLFFEDIAVDLRAPIDGFDVYQNGDPIRGCFAAFELNANIGYISFENIALTLYKERYPLSYLVCVGPKSVIYRGKEIFDPYVSSRVGTIEMENITVNGENPRDASMLVKTVAFDDVNGDGASTGRGEIGEIRFRYQI
ncbi:MAG: hypothetical protein IJV98_02840 [Clostridia bacterium]|nr:hypothetical protein [Clostridia bacterium]